MGSNKTENRLIHYLLVPGLAILLLSGCAGKRWTGPLAEEEQAPITASLVTLQRLEKKCPDAIDADAMIFWESPMEKWRVEGYLQLLSPSYVKFVITSPLGQPIYAFASNGQDYQTLHPAQHKHIRGKIRSLAIREEIPLILTQGDWFAYLTGRLPASPFTVLGINEDGSGNVWIQLSVTKTAIAGESVWLHFDPLEQSVLGYLFLDGKGKTLAEISYGDDRKSKDYCNPQEKLEVTGLPWGTTLQVKMKKIGSGSRFIAEDFTLPVPKGYATQLRP